MKHKTNKARAGLPTGLVVVDKGGGVDREILVGVLNGTRMPAAGFDVRGYAPNHYRVVNNGPFGVILGSRVPLEIRVILDGELVHEGKFIPTQIPLSRGMDPTLTEARASLPQPHMILHDQSGQPLMFKPFDGSLSDDEIIARQLHAEPMTPPALDTIDHGAPVTQELKVDLPEDVLARFLAPPPFVKPDNAANAAVTTDGGDATLTSAEQDGVPHGKDNLPADVPAFGDVYRDGDATAEVPPAPADDEFPAAIDTTERSKSWAPSHGLVAIGVRILQESVENELPSPPDAFTYVLFQMNPWEMHVKAMAALQGRVIVASKEELIAIMREEGFGDEIHTHEHEVSCGGISCDHRRRR